MSLQELLLLLGPPPVSLMEPRLLAMMLRSVPLLTLMTDEEVEAPTLTLTLTLTLSLSLALSLPLSLSLTR